MSASSRHAPNAFWCCLSSEKLRVYFMACTKRIYSMENKGVALKLHKDEDQLKDFSMKVKNKEFLYKKNLI